MLPNALLLPVMGGQSLSDVFDILRKVTDLFLYMAKSGRLRLCMMLTAGP